MNGYNVENRRLWSRLHMAAEMLGTEMKGLDRMLCVADGTLEVMEEYGIVPEGELLVRLRRFTGMTGAEIVFDKPYEPGLEAPRAVPVYKAADFGGKGEVMTRLLIETPDDDDREYVGVEIHDCSMERSGLRDGDIAVIRRQAIAEDGDLVAAEVNGCVMVRRFRRKSMLSWLEADGYVGEENDVTKFTDSVPSVRIWGKVVISVRMYERLEES